MAGGCRELASYRAGDASGVGGAPDLAGVDAIVDVGPDGRVDVGFDDVGASCSEGISNTTVALYGFNEPAGATSFADAVGKAPAAQGRRGGVGARVAGACRGALFVPAGTTGKDFGYAFVDDHAGWSLARGSIQLRVRYRGTFGGRRALLSRDALGNNDGHLTMLRDALGHFAVRLQTKDASYTACDARKLFDEEWHRVVLDFGPGGMKLYVDGEHRPYDGNTDIGGTLSCKTGATHEGGIQGNSNPWVIGASAASTTEGAADAGDLTQSMGGWIDYVMLSRERSRP